MMETEIRMSDYANTYAKLAVQFEDLWERGLEDSKEADQLTDAMDRPWYAMPEVERALVREFCIDLNMLHDRSLNYQEMSVENMQDFDSRLATARIEFNHGNPRTLLQLYRGPVPERDREKGMIGIWAWQSLAWKLIGLPEGALIFARKAMEADARHAKILITVLGACRRFQEERDIAIRVFSKPINDPAAIVAATIAILTSNHWQNDDNYQSDLEWVLPKLHDYSRTWSNAINIEKREGDRGIILQDSLRIIIQVIGEMTGYLKSRGRPIEDSETQLRMESNRLSCLELTSAA
jgi:hypothetical protein